MGFDVASIFAGGVGGIFTGIKDVVGAFKLDPTVAAANATKLAELEIAIKQAELQAEVQLSQAQTKINEIEAASTDKFTSRWRPAVGWVCCIGLAYATVLSPLLDWLGHNIVGWKEPPTLDVGVLTTTLFAILGIGGMRSFDKLKGTSR